MPRLIIRADGIEGLVPLREDFPGGRVHVGTCVLVPDGQVVPVVPDGAGVGPPDLVVGGGRSERCCPGKTKDHSRTGRCQTPPGYDRRTRPPAYYVMDFRHSTPSARIPAASPMSRTG